MTTTTERLREMGLTPVWRRRERAAPAGPAGLAGPTSELGAAAVSPPGGEVIAVVRGPRSGETIAAERAVSLRAAGIATLDWASVDTHIAGCTACGLCRTRKQTVPGVGARNAEWMFVGEGPGAAEDEVGEPFVGPAGRLLDNMLKALRLARDRNTFIANVVKCRPPANRDPLPEEVAQCAPYLERQVDLVKPKLIVALGRVAAQTLLGTDAKVGTMRGRVHDYRGVPLIVTYHPAYLLRNLPEKARSWEDLLFARRTLAALQSADKPPT